MVWHSAVAPGDVVLVDRNCHKSILHAITMTGAIPIFLMPTRNHFGIIGPIPKEEFDWKNIQNTNMFVIQKLTFAMAGARCACIFIAKTCFSSANA